MDQETQPEPASQPVRTSYGSLFSILVLLVVIVAGAFYVWHVRIEQRAGMENAMQQQELLETGTDFDAAVPYPS